MIVYLTDGDSIKVFLRVRPAETAVVSGLPTTARVVDVRDSKSMTLLSKPDPKLFTFDYIADSDSTQVYPLFILDAILHGENENGKNENCTTLMPKGNSYCRCKSSAK